MEAYRTKLTLRLAWWWAWWSICAFMFFGNAIDLILTIVNAIISHESPNAIYAIAKVAALLIFVIPTFTLLPAIDKLLLKDLNKDKIKLYAKSILLERKLTKRNISSEKRKSDEQIAQKIKIMEQQLMNTNNERQR